jgi:hypothetical protein
MLRDLDAARSDLGVASYGMSVTTLEEVFLLLASQEGPSDGHQEGADDGGGSSAAGGSSPVGAAATAGAEGASAAAGQPAPAVASERLGGARLYLQQLRALTIKRALCARWVFRSYK